MTAACSGTDAQEGWFEFVQEGARADCCLLLCLFCFLVPGCSGCPFAGGRERASARVGQQGGKSNNPRSRELPTDTQYHISDFHAGANAASQSERGEAPLIPQPSIFVSLLAAVSIGRCMGNLESWKLHELGVALVGRLLSFLVDV